MASQALTVQEQRQQQIGQIRQTLTGPMAAQFKAALPAHVSVEKFTRVALTALQNNPDLAGSDRSSLFGAFVRLAQDGLLPDGREAAVVMFGQKAQAMPMIAGVLKKIRQSGDVVKVSAQVVYENDDFVWSLGFDETVTHNPPKLSEPRGNPIGAYATAVLKDGSQLLEVMSLEEIEKVRAVSRAAKNGPWVAWWGEMARKTVMRRLSKRLPMSTDLEEAFDRDPSMDGSGAAPPVLEVVQNDRSPASRLDALEAQVFEPEGPSDDQRGDAHDDETVNEAARRTADDIIRRVRGAELLADVVTAENVLAVHRAAMPDELVTEVEGVIADRRSALAPKK